MELLVHVQISIVQGHKSMYKIVAKNIAFQCRCTYFLVLLLIQESMYITCQGQKTMYFVKRQKSVYKSSIIISRLTGLYDRNIINNNKLFNSAAITILTPFGKFKWC